MNRYIKLFENFTQNKMINEEWFPQDTFLSYKKDLKGSILEYYGNFLVEIMGENRRIEKTVDMAKIIINNTNNLSDFFNIDGKLKKIKGFTFQIESPMDIDYVKKNFIDLGEFIYPVNFYGKSVIEVELYTPLKVKS